MADELVVDFSQVQSRELLPTGWYDVEVAEISMGKTSSGNPKFAVRLRVVGGEHDGRILFDNWPLAGGGLFKTKNAYGAFIGTAEGSTTLKASDFLGGQAQARVTQRIWREEDGGDGEARNNVSKYKTLHPDEAFDSMFDKPSDPFAPVAPVPQEDAPF